MSANRVLLIGPGYVGREIIDLLLAEKYAVSSVARRENAKAELEKDGVTTYLGDLDDSELITNLTVESDIVFHTATADHLASAQAILAGVEKRAGEGKSTIYLHQSGTSVLSDHNSEALNPKIYSDLKPEDIEALPNDAPHRPIDLAIVATRKKLGDKAKLFIMMPPIIYGANPKYNRLSIQVPTLTRFALKHGYAGVAGKGEAAWGTIHVLDQAKAYIHILHWLEKSAPSVGLEHPYFFCENGETTWKEVSQIIGTALSKAGKVSTSQVKTIPESDYGDLFGDFTPDVVGCNCRNRAERLRKLGWKPEQKSLKDAFETEDLPILLEEGGFQSSTLSLSK